MSQLFASGGQTLSFLVRKLVRLGKGSGGLALLRWLVGAYRDCEAAMDAGQLCPAPFFLFLLLKVEMSINEDQVRTGQVVL